MSVHITVRMSMDETSGGGDPGQYGTNSAVHDGGSLYADPDQNGTNLEVHDGGSPRADVRRQRRCFVPGCGNTSAETPSKLFFPVPTDRQRRQVWAGAARRRDWNSFHHQQHWYCCQDHFNLKEDFPNYMRYKTVGGNLMLRKDAVPSKFDCQLLDLARSGVAAQSSTSNRLSPRHTSAVSLKSAPADGDSDAYESCPESSDGSCCSDDGSQQLFEGFTPHQLTARYQPRITATLGYDPTEPIRPPHQPRLVNFRKRTKLRGLPGLANRQDMVLLVPFEKGWKRLVVCSCGSEGVRNESLSNIIGVTYTSPDGRVCRNLQDIRDTMHRLPTNQQVLLSMFTFRRVLLDYPGAPYQQLVRTRSVLDAQRALLSNSLDEMRRLEQMEPPSAGRLRWLVKPSDSTSTQANRAKSTSCTRAFAVSSDGERVSLPVVGDSGSRTSVIGRTASVKRVVICSSSSSSNAFIRTQVEPASRELGLLERARLLFCKGWRRRLISWRPRLCSCGSCSDVLHVFYISPSGFKINSIAQLSAHLRKYSQGRFSVNQFSFSRHRLLTPPSPSSAPADGPVSSDCSYSDTGYETVIFPRLQPRVLLTRCHVSSSDTGIVPVNGDYSYVVVDVNRHNIGESALPRSYISNRLLRPFIYGWYRRVISCRCSGGVPDSTRVDVCYISPDGEQLNSAGALRYYLNRRGSGGHLMDRQCFLFAPVPLDLNVEYESWLISTELTSASALASAADPAHCRLTPLPDACPICHSPFNGRGSDYDLSLFRRQRACLWWNGSQRHHNRVVPPPAAHTLPRSPAAGRVTSLLIPAAPASVLVAPPPPAAVDSLAGVHPPPPPQQQTWCRQGDGVAAEPPRRPFKMSGLDRQNLWQIQKKYAGLKNSSDVEMSARADAHEGGSAAKKLKVAVKKKRQVSKQSAEVISSDSKVIGTVACAPCTLFCFWEQYGGAIICEPTAQCDYCLCVFHPRCAGLSNYNVERFICCGCALVNSGRLPSLIPPWREITFDELGCPTYLAPQILLSVLGNGGWSEASTSKPPPPPPLLRCISRSPTPTQSQQDDESGVHGKPIRPPPPLLKMAPPSTSAPPTAVQMAGIRPRTITLRPPPIGTSPPHTGSSPTPIVTSPPHTGTSLTPTGTSPPPTSTYPPPTAAHPPPPPMKERDHPQLFSSGACPPLTAARRFVEPASPPPGTTTPPVISHRVITIDHPRVPYQPLSKADASRGTNSSPVDATLPLDSLPTDSKPDAHPSKPADLLSKPTVAPSNVVVVSKPTILVSKPTVVVYKPTVVVSKPTVVVSKPTVVVSKSTVVVSKPTVVVSKSTVSSSNLVVVSKPTVASSNVVVVSKPTVVVSKPTVASYNVVVVSKPTIAVSKPTIVVSKPTVVVSKPTIVVYKPTVVVSKPIVLVSKPIVVVSKPTVPSSNVVAVSKPTVPSCKVVIRPLPSSLPTRLAVPPVKLTHPTSRVVRPSTISAKTAVCSARSPASPGRSDSRSIPTTRPLHRDSKQLVAPAHPPHKPTIPPSSLADPPSRISSPVITSPRPPYAVPGHTATKQSAGSAQSYPLAKYPPVNIPARLLSAAFRPIIQAGRKVVRLTPTNGHDNAAAELRSDVKPAAAVGNHGNRDVDDVTDGGEVEYRPGVKRSWDSGASPAPAKRRCFVEETGEIEGSVIDENVDVIDSPNTWRS